ncbi:uncharacterized protein C8R40DRAFT_716208 [Lentinula edodes]|uniref:uncharacterized protein n=1 Tax=Lentinula edodes TaxID=5353 RepID=UPI001E8E8016|nr:uncharacterized protein C8R40DRAFT_716208 [Lentinula edodes]KAH7869854.1 hypothetical protein C8R40DRAFT_716208 [Lentinula edodes]
MHFSPLHLLLGLLAIVHAAPLPATSDGKHLTLITRTDSSKPPFRIVVKPLGSTKPAKPDSTIPSIVKGRIAAHLNHGRKGAPPESQFLTKPLTVDEIKFLPDSVWDATILVRVGSFDFTWWDAQAQGFKWTEEAAGRELGVAHDDSVEKGEWEAGVPVLSGPGGKSKGILLLK